MKKSKISYKILCSFTASNEKLSSPEVFLFHNVLNLKVGKLSLGNKDIYNDFSKWANIEIIDFIQLHNDMVSFTVSVELNDIYSNSNEIDLLITATGNIHQWLNIHSTPDGDFAIDVSSSLVDEFSLHPIYLEARKFSKNMNPQVCIIEDSEED